MNSKLLLLAVFAACAVSAVPVAEDAQHSVHFVENNEEDNVESGEDGIERTNTYTLFTRNQPTSGQVIVKDDPESIANSDFNPEWQTVFVVHGFLSDEESGMNIAIRDAFLSQGDYNVIIVDWSRWQSINYVSAVRIVPELGRELGTFVTFLESAAGISLDNVHLIGFSLGAHLIGNTGRSLGGRVARITGLDPSGPLWTVNSNRISADDAQYVEVIHTDGNLEYSLGLGYAVGDIDFFPNGGSSQPGCISSSICSHNRAWRFYAATVSYNHLEGRRCNSTTQFLTNTCRGDSLKMGNTELKKTGSGRYRLSTGRTYPY